MIKFTFMDKVTLVLMVLFGIGGMFYISGSAAGINEKYVSIQIDGEIVKTITFGDNMIGKTYDFDTEYGFNRIEIGDGSVRMSEADCDDPVGWHDHSISNPGEILVCLPNKMLVEVKSKGKTDSEIDQISY